MARLTRRDFLQAVSGAAVASTLGERLLDAAPAGKSPDRARVVLVRDPQVLDESRKVDGPRLMRMLDRAMTELLGEKNPAAAWGRLFGPGDRVGIKSNEWEFLPTPPELEQAIRLRLEESGVAPAKIAVRDRGTHDDPAFTGATALVNVRPLRTHHWAGVGSLIKNMITFTPTPWDWHDDSCADLAGIWKLPTVRGKVRLNVLVMLTPLFHGKGAHHYQAAYTWPYAGLLVGTDPVAVDATGLRILEAQRERHFSEQVPFTVPPHHIRVAAEKHGLGIADPARIELVRIGPMDDALI